MLPLWGINTAVDKEVCAVKAEWQALYGAKVLCAMCCVQVARRRYDNAMESESVLSIRKLCSVWDVLGASVQIY